MKICSKCGIEKDFSEFYKRGDAQGGYRSACKECTNRLSRERHPEKSEYHKKWMKEYYQRNKEHYQIKGAEYRRTEQGKMAAKKANDKFLNSEKGKISRSKTYKKYAENNPEKIKAHYLVKKAIKNGEMVRQPCEVCGSEYRVHGHHDDYSKPYDVIWLCTTHHMERHRIIDIK